MRTILTLLALVAIAMPVQAHHCTTWTSSTTNDEMIVLELPVDVLSIRWIVNDLCQDDPPGEPDPDPYGGGSGGPCLFAIWLYYEANGIPGLQRADEMRDDTCHWMIEGDSFVW